MPDYSSYLASIDAHHEAMSQRLAAWASVNSGSYNLTGLETMLSLVSETFLGLGAKIKAVELQPQTIVDRSGVTEEKPLGRLLHARKRPTVGCRVLLCCHMDTVYGPDHPFQEPELVDAGTLRGPGVTDAKGGIVVMMEALKALETSPWANYIGWEAIINPDEEIGSPGSVPLLLDAAQGNDIGLVFEPSFPDGALVAARKGSGTFAAVVTGRAAHAGREPHLGRNAVQALARFVIELTDFQGLGEGVTINVGYIEGGGPVNVVPDRALCRFNVRVSEFESQRLVEAHVREVSEQINRMDGISLEIHGGFGRPPKPPDAATQELLSHVFQCGRDLGISLEARPSGGACDGNNLVAVGLPTVDSLGVTGGEIHSDREYVSLGSLTERAKLSALLLMKLASREIVLTPRHRSAR